MSLLRLNSCLLILSLLICHPIWAQINSTDTSKFLKDTNFFPNLASKTGEYLPDFILYSSDKDPFEMDEEVRFLTSAQSKGLSYIAESVYQEAELHQVIFAYLSGVLGVHFSVYLLEHQMSFEELLYINSLLKLLKVRTRKLTKRENAFLTPAQIQFIRDADANFLQPFIFRFLNLGSILALEKRVGVGLGIEKYEKLVGRMMADNLQGEPPNYQRYRAGTVLVAGVTRMLAALSVAVASTAVISSDSKSLGQGFHEFETNLYPNIESAFYKNLIQGFVVPLTVIGFTPFVTAYFLGLANWF